MTRSPDSYDPLFPWDRCMPGRSFFVPSLDPERTMRLGMEQANLQLGFGAKRAARVGVYKGMLGVLFSLPPRPKQRPTPPDSGDSPRAGA